MFTRYVVRRFLTALLQGTDGTVVARSFFKLELPPLRFQDQYRKLLANA
jgi:hypothetical protein